MTLQLKITLLLTTIIIAITSCSFIITDRIMRNAFDSETTDKGKILVESLADSIANQVIDNNILEVNQTLHALVKRTKNLEYAYVIGFEGRLFTHTFEKGFPKTFLDEMHNGQKNFPGMEKYFLAGKPIVDLSYPLITGLLAHVHIGLDETCQVERFVLLEKQIFSLATAVGIVAILLGYLISRKITDPLERLCEYVDNFGKGTLRETMEITGCPPEISQLNNSFNTMVLRREAAEQQLKESEKKYRTLFESSADALTIMDMDTGAFIDCNVAAVKLLDLGTRENFMESTVDTISPKYQPNGELSRDLAREHIQRALTEGSDTFEWSHCKSDGLQLPVLISLSAMNLGEKKLMLAIGRDLSNQKKLEAELIQAHKMQAIGTLAGGVAHEFNNSLNVIMMALDIALNRDPGADITRRQLTFALQACGKARDLVRQILTFSRKRMDRKLVPLQLASAVKEAMEFIRPSIPTSVVTEIKLKTGLDPVLADSSEISQIFMNICSNAVWAMEEKGVLSISLEEVYLGSREVESIAGAQAGRYLKLSVSDTGRGMDAETRERVFEPFFTTKEVGRGTGMGMALVHGIIASYHGAITLDSAPGEGTTFHLYFPAIESPPLEKEEVSAGEIGESGPLPTGSERILFVDDEELLTKTAKNILCDLGYTVTTKTNGEEALAIFKAAPADFDLVITDQVMPRLSGDDLSREILAIRPDIPIILCTGYNARIDGKKAKALGIREYVVKPITWRDIALLIRKVLAA